MFPHIEELFPLLLQTLSDPSDKVVHCNLKVLSEIISSPTSEVKKEETVSSKNELSKTIKLMVPIANGFRS